MKNKPLQQNLSCTGNSGLWTVLLQYQQYKILCTLLHTKSCARLWTFYTNMGKYFVNIFLLKIPRHVYIYIRITIPADRFLANRKVNMPVLAFT